MAAGKDVTLARDLVALDRGLSATAAVLIAIETPFPCNAGASARAVGLTVLDIQAQARDALL